MRSKYRDTGRKQSLADVRPSSKSSTCWSTGSGARETKMSPGRKSTGSRLTCAVAAAVTRFVAPGPDRRRARHHPPPEMRLRIRNRRVRHRLLVVRTVRRQRGTMPVKRLAESGDVSVAEDRPHAGEERDLAPIVDRALCGQITDQRLRHRQPDHRHHVTPCARRAPRVDQHLEVRAHGRDEPGVVDRIGEPRACRLAEYRAADGKTATGATARGGGESACQFVDGRIETEEHDAATVRIAFRDQRIERRPFVP